jgi:tetratricopeptide (TPR) repeat protein
MTKYKPLIIILFIFFIIWFIIIKVSNYFSIKNFEKKLSIILPENENNFNFTKTIIKISCIFDPTANEQWIRNQINFMANNLKQRIGNEANPDLIIEIFNDYFFNIEKLAFDENFNDKKNLSYSQLIKFNSIQNALITKKSICLTISLIYLMLGDILNLPLYGVLIPGHIYVRYKENGKSSINIETTLKGYEYYGYMNMFGLDIYKDKNSYGKELNKFQTIGAYLNNLGSFLLSVGELQKAEILFKKSIKYLPLISEPYMNLGILYEQINKPEAALTNYLKSIEINPDNDFVLTQIGIIFYNQNRFIKAQEFLEKAIKINKNNIKAQEFLKNIKGENK